MVATEIGAPSLCAVVLGVAHINAHMRLRQRVKVQ